MPATIRIALAVAICSGVWPAPARAQETAPPAEVLAMAGQHQGHAGHGSGTPAPPAASEAQPPPHDHTGHQQPDAAEPGQPVPPITDADRAAAFPNVRNHAVHDDTVHYYVLFDQLEWVTDGGAGSGSWDNKGWIGHDVNRLWFRTEGDGEGSRLESAQAHLLFGHAIARWWEVVAGVREDVRPGPAQTWAAVGIQGLAPYWFEVEATAYVGAGGRTHFRFETEYELLLTNRLVLQPLVEVEVYGKDDPERGIGAGLSSADAGLRLRYEVRREFAPYVGVVWNRKFFGTADAARTAGESVGGARLALGVRVWM